MKKRWATVERKALDAIRRHTLMNESDRVLVAVSGGADSVALLSALRELAPVLKIRLAVAHLNHGLRGRAAAKDAEFVQALAAQWNLPCTVGRARVRDRARRYGLSIEMAARVARYSFLERCAKAAKADVVAVAHTADDQAETVLLKLARGAGTDGLGGMRPHRALRNGLALVRPLLETGRKQIEAYLMARGLSWREDDSNADRAYLRNRVRHEILPALEALNPKIRAALGRTAELCQADSVWLDEQARTLLNQAMTAKERVVSGSQARNAMDKRDAKPFDLDCEPLLAAPDALGRRALRLWLLSNGVPMERLDFELADRIVRLLRRRQGGGRMPIGGGWIVMRHARHLKLARNEPGRLCGKQFDTRDETCRSVRVPGTTLWPELGLRVTVKRARAFVKVRESVPGRLPASASLGMAKLDDRPLRMRLWRPGDRMRPWGLNGGRKLQDIFTDAKTPLERRGTVPVFECDGEIVWLPGYRIAQGWGMLAHDAACWRIRVKAVGKRRGFF